MLIIRGLKLVKEELLFVESKKWLDPIALHILAKGILGR